MEAQLKTKGWFFSTEGLQLCEEGLVNPSADTITQTALDIDLRSMSSGCPNDANHSKTDIQGPLILQIQKIRNVAAPKMNEDSSHAPKLLRIQLTDGHNFHSGLLLHSIPKIDMNTPPGTKVLIKGKLALKQGLALLDQHNTKVLGGHVDEMVERWKLVKTLSQFTRASKVEGAPPPWVPFGQRKKMDSSQRNDHSFRGGKKSLETAQKDLTESDKAFEEQRKAAIQGAGKHQSKKFGGGKVVPSNEDRLNEHRRQQQENREVAPTRVIPATPANTIPKTSQGIYRDLSHNDASRPDERDVQKLTSMGFPREACISALKRNNGNVDSAVETLLSGATDDVDPAPGDNSMYNGRDRDGGRDFDSRRGGFDSRRGGFDSRRGGFDSRRGGFDNRRGGFDNRRGGRGSDTRPGGGGRNFDSRGRGRGSDSRRRRGGDEEEEDDEYSAQPSGGTTLFDFLESKLAKDHPSKESSGGGQRQRNYAKEQPPSVREAGIKSVHDGAAKDDGRRDGRNSHTTRNDPPSRSNQGSDSHEGRNDRSGGRYDRRGGSKYDSQRDGDVGGQSDNRSSQSDNRRGQYDSRGDQSDNRRGQHGNRGGQNDSRGGQNDSRGGPNDRRPTPRRTDDHQQGDKGPGRPRQDKSSAQNSQRNTQYTLPPRFQRRQDSENKRSGSGGGPQSSRQDDGENRRGGRSEEDRRQRDSGPKRSDSQRSNGPRRYNGPQRDSGPGRDESQPNGPQENGPQVNGDGGPGTYRLQQRPQPSPVYEGGNPPDNMVRWNIGDMCAAKYWEDNTFYTATITALHPSGKTCVVHFIEYGNQEEVMTSDILPLQNQPWGGMASPHQYPPPNHIMVPQPFQDTRNAYQRGPPQRYN